MRLLDIPFFKQTSKLNCGPSALKMVLDYFGEDVSIGVLEERVGIKEGKGTSSIQVAMGAKLSGFNVRVYSKIIGFNDENKELDFYKKYAGEDLESAELIERARKLGVEMEERTIDLDELLNYVSEDSVMIILLDWNVVKDNKEKGFLGHFVVVTGFDDENVFVHDHGLNDPKENRGIKREVFEAARKSLGTDEDVIVIRGEGV